MDTVIEALKSFKTETSTWTAGEVYLVRKALAEQFIREGKAKLVTVDEEQEDDAGDADAAGPTEPVSAGEDWRPHVAKGDYFDWQALLTLPLLAKPYIRGEFRNPPVKEKKGKRKPRTALLVGGFGKAPKKEQEAAVVYLRTNEAALLARVLDALAAHVRQLRAGGGWEDFDDPPGIDAVMPRGMAPAQVAERIEIGQISVDKRARDGVAYLEFVGNCAWDPDAGFLVALHNDRVVHVGGQGDGWTDRKGK